MKIRSLLKFLIFNFMLCYSCISIAETDDDFISQRDKLVADIEEKISCLKGTNNWDEWGKCHQEADHREKLNRLQELKEEQRQLEEELQN